MRILVFSEEYTKTTKGMFVVWMNYVREVSKTNHVDILLNNEHWGSDEVSEEFKANPQVEVHHLSFDMPSTIIKRIILHTDGVWFSRALRYALGQVLNYVLSPFIIFYISVLLRHLHPGAIFSHNGGWPAGQLCRWIIVAAMLAGIPRRILIIHNYPACVPWLLLPVRFIQAWIIDKSATSIVTVSDSVKNILEADIFKRTVHRIYNGINITTQVQRDYVKYPELEWSPSGLTVGFVGALYPLKGPHVLLDAFSLVDVPCELALLGPADKHYLTSLKLRAEICTNKVSFLGFHQDVDNFMQKIDFLVVPSIAFESFGMVILEAMKHRKPVICSDHGGMKEIVEDGVTGLVAPVGNEHAMAKAITTLLGDADMRHQMGEAGYFRLKGQFTSEKMANEYEKLIEI